MTGDTFETVLVEWHAGLMDDRGGRAALRRARTLDDVLMDGVGASAFMRLWRRLPGNGPPYALARAALAAAELDEDMRPADAARPLFAQRCAALGDGRVFVSPDRFRLLMSAIDADEFLRLLRSSIGLTERRAPLIDVADLARSWSCPERREGQRRRQLLAYYAYLPDSALEA
jgi:CRISPR type I-E-associated protein CasB/Cse2